ncbi:MAG: TGS domain-containing protein, partial [Spirochaetota bacterium]
MSQITVTLPDGKTLLAEKGSTVYTIIGLIGKGLQKAALAAEVNGNAVDLMHTVDSDSILKVVTFKDAQGKKILWHSASHVLAQAVLRLYPDARPAIGPAIDEGFFYDFDREQGFTREDLDKIEKEISTIIAENLPIKRIEMCRSDAQELFRKNGDIYKRELLDAVEGEPSFYTQGDFTDLCRGPHVPSTGVI